ncbi:MAG: VOC family protein [Propionibacteriaceae bacterium]|jgi:catechol 2,3-dioxygenase-like lactoylglutathione lyase family enzyme|nr:VOC family protein [Propionibacteriaceae bacterium]
MLIHHVSFQCADYAAATAFYDAVLAPLGAGRVMEIPGHAVAYGLAGGPELWLGPLEIGDGFREAHIAFTAPSREAVDAFFAAAEAAGAEILHRPRLWPEYRPTYYGAFVRDPDGNNVEAVCMD